MNQCQEEQFMLVFKKHARLLPAAVILGVLIMLGQMWAGHGTAQAAAGKNTLQEVDMNAWLYEEDSDVYYQTGLSYCALPADEEYETMGIYVPGAYFDAIDNGDGTYTCTINESGKAGNFTAADAPMVIPVNTPGYSAMSAPSGYTDVSAYTDAGMIYLYAGCRGRDHGAPAGVTDLKAAIRYIRSNAALLPGDSTSIFSFGMSGGGAQSALLGAAGDAEEYDDYLEEIGAVMDQSDVVLGSMCWCPITSLEAGDMAYEWQLGQTRSGLDDEEQAVSDELARAFASYINDLGLTLPSDTGDEEEVLLLEESEEGIYQAGSYYDYVKSEIERSLENFLQDTEFPYDASASDSGFGRGGFGGGRDKDGSDGGPENMGQNENREGNQEIDFESIDNISRSQTTGGLSLTGTYETAADYIDALNEEGSWVSYDEDTGEVTITSLADFTSRLKLASKGLGAFDQLDRGQGENTLFGYGDGNGAHFDQYLSDVLLELDNDYALDYMEDLEREDALGRTPQERLEMYSPLYYLLPANGGYGGSMPAAYWRIRTGINQADTSNATEINLALALGQYPDVEDVDFEMVWGKGHTQAERTGDAESNFIEWVDSCMAGRLQNGNEDEQEDNASEEIPDEDGYYTSKEDVALYIHTYGKLPGNYITKKDAEELGWESYKGNLWDVAPGKSIGGSYFGNYEGLLPSKKGRKYYECDIDYDGGRRGAKRIIYSNDGLVFYTGDHYKSFEQLYPEE